MREKQKNEIEFEPENKNSEEPVQELQRINLARERWEKFSVENEKNADALGHGIDKDIKETVTSLNALDIETIGSCEGHTEAGSRSAPWISIAAPGEPEERFIGQNKAFEKVAAKYNMPVEETKRMYNIDAYWEAIHACRENGETKEFQKWKDESKKLLYQVKNVLSDFYKDRQVPDNVKIKIDIDGLEGEGVFEIINGGDDQRIVPAAKLSDEEKEFLEKRIHEYREEMKAFAGFVKDKVFNKGDSYVYGIRNKALEEFDKGKIKEIERELKRKDVLLRDEPMSFEDVKKYMKIERLSGWPDEEELEAYLKSMPEKAIEEAEANSVEIEAQGGNVDEIIGNYERFKNAEGFEVRKMKDLKHWDKIKPYLEQNDLTLDNVRVILADNAEYWKNFYGSNSSKSSVDPETIIMKKEIFESEDISEEDLSWIIHEIGHLSFYDFLGDKAEEYMQGVRENKKYMETAMESVAFQTQIDFLKSLGKTKEESAAFMESYIEESFGADSGLDDKGRELKQKESEQLMRYVEGVYGK